MKPTYLVSLAAAVVLCAALTAGLLMNRDSDGPEAQGGPASCSRIVSMAPSITEILFALDLGPKVVGVTRYCDYPPEALAKPKVGGFLDPNYEALVAARPDLVVLLPVHVETKANVAKLGIPILEVDHRDLKGIYESLAIVGRACDAGDKAAALEESIRRRVARVRGRTAGLPRPRVLISGGRSLGSGRLEEVYVAGKRQWYDEIITLAGGVNAFEDDAIQFPSLSAEGLLRLNPDVIIEMAPDLDTQPYTEEDVVREWSILPSLKAVREGRVYVLGKGYATIPGPRFVDLLEDVARLLHPDVDWSG